MPTLAPIYKFQRGEPIVIGREVLSGDPVGFTVEAVLKKTSGQVVPKAAQPTAATFAVTFDPAAGTDKARWTLTIPAEATAELETGQYATDAKFLLDGTVVEISDPAFITLAESVSG